MRPDPRYDVSHYEGLVRKTAGMYVEFVEEDYDDVCSILRIKAWRALCSYDPTRSKLPVERYVFSCVKNQCKDLLKKKKRGELFIEDVAPVTAGRDARDAFEDRYLCMDEEDALGGLLDDIPLIPSTLSDAERRVVALLYADYSQAEIALQLAMTKREVAADVKAIKRKMSDWKPSDSSQDDLGMLHGGEEAGVLRAA